MTKLIMPMQRMSQPCRSPYHISKKLRENDEEFGCLELNCRIEAPFDLIRALAKNRTVRSVFLHEKFLWSLLWQDEKLLIDSLCHLETLDQLFVNYKGLSSGGMKALVHTIKGHTSLRSLAIKDVSISQGKLSIEPLMSAIASAPNLEKVTLSITSCSQQQHDKLQDVNDALGKLCQSNSILVLKLRLDDWSQMGFDCAMEAIAKNLKKNRTLKELSISGRHVSQQSWKTLGELLQGNQSIESLKIRNQNSTKGGTCSGEGLKHLVTSMERNFSLKQFSFRDECDKCRHQCGQPCGNKGRHQRDDQFWEWKRKLLFYLHLNRYGLRGCIQSEEMTKDLLLEKLSCQTNCVSALYYLLRMQPDIWLDRTAQPIKTV